MPSKHTKGVKGTYGAERKTKEPVVTWLRRMARKYGTHPRLIMSSSPCLKDAGVQRSEVTPTLLRQATKECWDEAVVYAQEVNSSPQPRSPSWVELSRPLWFHDPEEERKRLEAQRVALATISALSSSPESGAGIQAKRRYDLFDHPVTAVLRWMGKSGWRVDEAKHALKGLGIDCSPNTISIQVRAGAKGDGSRGEPADLDPGQIKQLEQYRR